MDCKQEIFAMFPWEERAKKDYPVEQTTGRTLFDVFIGADITLQHQLMRLGFIEYELARNSFRWMYTYDKGLLTITYTEGDLCFSICENYYAYITELSNAKDYYREN